MPIFLETLRLSNFRNYSTASAKLSPGVNIFYGPNGQGKTSILEAVHYLCLTKSFKTSDDRHVLRFDAGHFEIEGRLIRTQSSFEKDRHEQNVRVAFMPGQGKALMVDGVRQTRFSEWIGRWPVVISAPEDVSIVSGGSGERRRWLDIVLSQVQPLYLKDLQEYRQCLRQRNALLATGMPEIESLASWDAVLVRTGSRIIRQRMQFLDRLAPLVGEVYRHLVPDGETIDMRYRTSIRGDSDVSESDVETVFLAALDRGRDRELHRGISLYGPHRDEIDFYLNGRAIRDYGSQGQYKTLAVALKFGEYLLLHRQMERMPLLLLDDVFSELDGSRRKKLVEYLSDAGQVFLTTADSRPDYGMRQEIEYFTVQNGTIAAA